MGRSEDMLPSAKSGWSASISGLLLVGASLDMAWVAEFWWSNGLSSTSAYLSQWETPGAEHAQWWRACFTAADLAVTLAALLVLWSRPQGPSVTDKAADRHKVPLWTSGWTALVVFGLSTAASDVIPARVTGTACAAVIECLVPPGTVSGDLWAWPATIESILGVHGAMSIVSGVSLIVAVGALTMSAEVTGGAAVLARFGRFALAGQMTSSVLLVAAIVFDTLAGIAGRLELTTEAGCLTLLAGGLGSMAAPARVSGAAQIGPHPHGRGNRATGCASDPEKPHCA